jgi:hypothetical protein
MGKSGFSTIGWRPGRIHVLKPIEEHWTSKPPRRLLGNL